MRHLVRVAVVRRLVGTGQDIDPLHHAEVLMSKDVAMHDKAPNCNRIEMDPKGNRPARSGIDIWLGRRRKRLAGLRGCTGHDDRIVPFGGHEGLAVYLGDQKVVLMDMERMIGK